MVDNGSRADSLEKLRNEFPSVRYIENNKNLGCATGRNRGILYARDLKAEFVLTLDNDVEVEPNFLNALVKEIKKDPKIVAA